MVSIEGPRLEKFKKWEAEEKQKAAKYGASQDPRGEFAQALSNLGFKAIGTIVEGKLTRIMDSQDKGNKRTGWYVYHEFDDTYNDGHVIGCGSFGSWRDDETHQWMSRGVEYMTPAERDDLKERRRVAEEERKAAEAQRHLEAAQECYTIYDNAGEASADHAYLQKKQIEPRGAIKQGAKGLIIPMMDSEMRITSLQYITENEKKYHPGGKIKGSFFVIPGNLQKIYVVEGYSTGVSVNMATDCAVYCAFMWSSLYEVACIAKQKHPQAEIVIAADDDAFIDKNVGRNAAMEISSTLKIAARFPEFQSTETKPTDWNDLHCLEGLEQVREQLVRQHQPYVAKESDNKQMPEHLFSPSGFLGDVVNYYRITDKRQNDLLALPTALALTGHILGRNFETNFSNRSSMFILAVARTGAGKEHGDRVIKKILAKMNQDHLANVSGYKSATALFCKCLDMPRHLCIINEWGVFLDAMTSKQASSHQAQVKGALLECSTKLDGIMAPPAYATRGLKEQEKKALDERVMNPAVSILATCTPEIWNQITNEMVQDGFLNRHEIFISDEPVKYLRFTENKEVPESIIKWIEKIEARLGDRTEIASEFPTSMARVSFTDDAMEIISAYERKCTDLMNVEMVDSPLKNMLPRAAERAMRIALIKALSDNPDAEFIYKDAAQWAVDMVDYNVQTTLKTLKRNLANSPHEKKRMDWLRALREAGAKGVLASKLASQKPFSSEPKRIREELINDLIEAGHAARGQRETGKRGRQANYIYAIESED